MEDREMIRRIQNGQKEYLNQIAEKYYNDIYYFCCYQTGSLEDAYDLAQDTFLQFIRYVDNYKYQNLKGYLLTIAMNLCRNYIREKALTPEEPVSLHTQKEPVNWGFGFSAGQLGMHVGIAAGAGMISAVLGYWKFRNYQG